MKLTIHTDGGARGNPGPAAIGVVIESEGTVINQFGKTIGHATNNVAEYTAVIEALKSIQVKPERIDFFLDSTLVVNQINGLFKIKESHLRELLFQVHALEQTVGGTIAYTAVRREQNREADLLVNEALDKTEQ